MSVKPYGVRFITNCAMCESGALEVAWSLPLYPFTEQFGPYSRLFPTEDLTLLICRQCNHVQLGAQVAPDFLYNDDTYSLSTPDSPKIREELRLFSDFINAIRPPRGGRVLEFGANNLRFSQQLHDLGYDVLACDPLVPITDQPGIATFRGRVEELLASGEAKDLDLVVARHTLEHIADPVSTIELLFDACSPAAILIFEVPSLEHLAKRLRFDAVIHQHYHYFTTSSVHRLAEETRSSCIALSFNERGSNGGSMFFALSRAPYTVGTQGRSASGSLLEVLDARILQQRILLFTDRMRRAAEAVSSLDSPAFGFGASLMLATQNFHMLGAVERLSAIYDDDESRSGTTYRNVNVTVRHSGFMFPLESPFVVTSLENSGRITDRLHELGVRRIVSPLA